VTALEKVHLLCCAAAFVVAAYEKIRLTPHGLARLASGAFLQSRLEAVK
jgi:hypothetical protein